MKKMSQKEIKEQLKIKLDQWLTTSISRPQRKDQQVKWLVLSFDALAEADLPLIKQYPNFNKLLSGSAQCHQVRSVYPSMTYPCHSSVVTGKAPKKHGITSNTLLQPSRIKPDWHWHYKGIHGPSLFSEAAKAGLSTAALLWPVTGGGPIAYNLPEIFPNRPWQSQRSVSLLNGSKRYSIQMDQRHGHLRKGLDQPHLDSFVHQAALDTLKTYQPNLLFVHYTDLDSQKHRYGNGSPEVKEALKRLDQKLGDYFKVLKHLPHGDEVKLLVFGDHGSRDVHTAIRPNVMLQKEGFLSVENGRLHHCDFVFKSCDGSAYLYHDNLHRVTREVLRQELDIIEEAIDKYNQDMGGILKLMRGHEAGFEGADASALLMLEAAEGYYFLDDYEGELYEAVSEQMLGTEHWLKAAHGYHPDTEGYKSLCFFWGKGIAKTIIPDMSLMDIGVTLAADLNLDLGDTDGTSVL